VQKNFIKFALIPTLLISIFFIRFYFVNHYAMPLPFWDEWDSEGDYLLRSWVEGTLKVSDLWQLHNEHRIFPTRLLSLLLYRINGQWNNLALARINVFLAVIIPALLIWFLLKFNVLYGRKLWLLPVIIAQFALPFSFENMLVGFQSQFYFLILFTVAALGLAASYPKNWYVKVFISILCFLSIFTMASGILTPLAVSGVLILYWLDQHDRKYLHLFPVAALIIMAIIGYADIPHILAHDIYRARNFSEWIHSALRILSWPTGPHSWIAAPLWLPGAITIPILLRKKKLCKSDLFMAGCFMWSFAQALAIAFGRGQELTAIPSRYTDLLSIGLIGNAWFALRFTEQYEKQKWQKHIMLAIFPLFFNGHKKRFEFDLIDMKRIHKYSVIQTRNVTKYYETHNPAYLQQPTMHIPYPDSVRLKNLLDNPTIKKLLPSEIRGKYHVSKSR